MLSDRNYMGNPIRNRGGAHHMSVVSILIFASVAVYVLQFILPVDVPVRTPYGMETYKSDRIVETFALTSTAVQNGQWFRVITHMFVHGSFWHILFNMWGLYLFGSLLESRIGSSRFLGLYFLSGLVGAACWLILNWKSPVPCIGASGAITGVIIATAMFFPDLPIMLLFPPIPMKLRTFAIVFVVVEIFFELTSTAGGIAHIVHLGGGLGGFLFVKIFCRGETGGFRPVFRRSGGEKLDSSLSSRGWSIKVDSVSQSELDRLLDKISSEGINSLSEEEMETLRRAREEMKSRE